MAMRKLLFTLLSLSMLFLGTSIGELQAQNTVNLVGRVTDNTGKPLSGAQIVVRNQETNQQRGALTRADGSYSIVGLAPGSYVVSQVMLGYAADEKTIRLSLGHTPTLNFALFEEAVAVKAVEASVNREATFEVQRNDVSSPVVTTEIVNLPLNTRNTMNLAAIVPGVKTFAPTAGRSLPAVGSLPDLRFWNFYLDGVEWKSFFNGNLVGIPQTGSPLPQEAMREFRVHLNPYDAAYTRGSSFIISAESQRGTNEFHGSIFGFGQNNDLNSHDDLQGVLRENPSYRRADYGRWQAGFNLRGPIQRDRTFFSVSYEGQSTDNTLTVNPRNTVWSTFAKDYAAPTVNHTGVTRLTHTINDAHTADFTYATRYYDSETNFGGTVDRSGGLHAKYWVHSAQLRDTYTPDANTVNELSLNLLSWSHSEAQMEAGRQQDSYPGIRFGTNGFPLELSELTFRLVNRFTKSLADGRHIVTAGAEAARVNIDAWLPNNRDGSFAYTVDDPNAMPSTASIGMGFLTGTDEDARAKSSGWAIGAYVQDQWSVSRNFLLTLGLRWDAELNTLNNDFESPFADDPTLRSIPMLQNFLVDGDRKNDLNNFAPRMSFSWDVKGDGRTYVRGGAGLMYDRITTFMSFFEKRAAGWRVYNFTNPGTRDPEVLRQRVRDGEGSNLLSLNLMKKDMQVPYNIQMSLGLGQQLAEGLALNVDYIHQDAKNLYVQVTPNYRTSATTRNLTNSFGDITLYDDFGEATFDAIASSLTYNRPGLRLNGAYTLGWYRSTFEGLGGYNDQTFFVMQPSTGDERHRVALSGVGDLPYGFKLSGVFIVATPRPYVATLGQDTNGDLNFGNDFLNGKADRTITPDYAWESMYRTFDIRLAKSVALGGDRKVSVSAEAFNVFDWVNRSTYDGRQRDASGTMRSGFGNYTGVFAPRQAQVGMRYEF